MIIDAQDPPKTARVLLVVDQPVLAGVIQLALAHGPYMTRVATNVVEATSALEAWQPHLAVIDMDLVNGTLLNQLGSETAAQLPLPIIALTRRGDLAAKLDAFEQGVDDILTVPFSPEEFVARTLALMRRTYRAEFPFKPVLRLGELEIDILNRSVRVADHELHLTALDLSLLYLLAANAGRVMSRDEILDHLWGVDFLAESNVVDRHVRNLRAKLQNSWRRPRYIATVPGQGYRFVPTTEDASALAG
ncbi:MAG: two-component response regulator [Thermomicrobiales bacterium]|nr:two-component response regulator [Thermomicrobiales bacterium]